MALGTSSFAFAASLIVTMMMMMMMMMMRVSAGLVTRNATPAFQCASSEVGTCPLTYFVKKKAVVYNAAKSGQMYTCPTNKGEMTPSCCDKTQNLAYSFDFAPGAYFTADPNYIMYQCRAAN